MTTLRAAVCARKGGIWLTCGCRLEGDVSYTVEIEDMAQDGSPCVSVESRCLDCTVRALKEGRVVEIRRVDWKEVGEPSGESQ